MKIKTIISLVVIILLIFIIYVLNIDNKVYYLNITDQKSNYYINIKEMLNDKNKLEKYIEFTNDDYRITDLINDINNNKSIIIDKKEQTIQNSLIKADIVTIKMGDKELEYKIDTEEISELFNYCDTLIDDVDKLLVLIRKYCKEDIYFIGLNNNHSAYYDEIYNYLNLKIEDICKEYNIKFIPFLDLNNVNIYQQMIK